MLYPHLLGRAVRLFCVSMVPVGWVSAASAQDSLVVMFERDVAGPAFVRASRDNRCVQTLASRVPEQFLDESKPPAWIVLAEGASVGAERRSSEFLGDDSSSEVISEREVHFARVTVLFRASFVTTSLGTTFLLRDLLPPGHDASPISIQARQSYLIFAGEAEVATISVACVLDELADVTALAYGMVK
jgi:hypothetical protein